MYFYDFPVQCDIWKELLEGRSSYFGKINKIKEAVIKVRIRATLNHVSFGKSPLKPPTAKELERISQQAILYELRIKLNSDLLRIFSVYEDDNIFLLEIMIKPDLYEKALTKKINRLYQEKINSSKQKYIEIKEGKANLLEFDL